MAIKNQEIGAKTKKTKDKPVPAVCVCGELPVDVKSIGLGVCFFCKSVPSGVIGIRARMRLS